MDRKRSLAATALSQNYVNNETMKQSGVVTIGSSGSGGGGGGVSMGQQIPQPVYASQLNKPTQVTQEIITNQLKIKICLGGFNHSGFETRLGLVDQIVADFNTELDNLIRLSYLTLTLKEINENRKWNSLLHLKGCYNYFFCIYFEL